MLCQIHLVLLLNIIQSNISISGDSWIKEVDIIPNGVSINPGIALFNHSCDPNMSRIQNGKYTIGIANRTIQKNDEVWP